LEVEISSSGVEFMEEILSNSNLIKNPRLLKLIMVDHLTFRMLVDQVIFRYGLLTQDGSNFSDYKEITLLMKKVKFLMFTVMSMLRTEMSLFGTDMEVLTNNGRSFMLMLLSLTQLQVSTQILDSTSTDHSISFLKWEARDILI
jgi:hypothetical protein